MGLNSSRGFNYSKYGRWSLVIESPKGNEPKLISESNFNSQNEAIVKQMMPFTDNMKIG